MARAMSKGGWRKPNHPGTPSPNQGRQRSKRAIGLPHLCRMTNTITSHETTQPRSDPGPLHGLWGCGQWRFPAFCEGTPTWEPGEGGAGGVHPQCLRGGHGTSSLPGETNQVPMIGRWLVTPHPLPRPLKVKAWATSTCESSQAGCLECERCSRQAGGTWGSASGSQEAREGRKSLSEHFSSTCLSCTCQRFVETPRVSRRPQECRLLLPPRILEAALGGQGSCLRSWNWKAGPRSGQPGSARRRVTSGHRSPLSTEPTFGVGQAIDSQS